MIVGLGIDLVEIARIKALYERHGERFLRRILTAAEREYVLLHRDPSARLAGRWAAKEAASKALGTGISGGIRWTDIEIVNDPSGAPKLVLHAKAREQATRLNAATFHISVTHCEGIAMAQVILETL